MSEPEAPTQVPAEPYVSKVDRRTTLAWLGVAGFAAPAAANTQSAPAQSLPGPIAGTSQTLERPKGPPTAPPPNGYGADPELVKPKPAPWPRRMTQPQLQTAALLCDFILPASADAPSANALGVPDFIDEWVSAPYPQQVADRPVVLTGLAWVEDEARRRFGKSLADLAAGDRVALLTPLTVRPAAAAAQAPHAFFRKFRSLVIGAYYTTKPGFKDIGYIGNVPRLTDPGPSDEVKAALDAALRKVGL